MSEQDIIALIRRYAGSGGGGAGGGGGSSVPTTITLEGNVTGTGSSTIVTTVDPSILGIRDAPVDSLSYWRAGGQWQPVPGNITSLSTVYGDGMMAYTDDEGWVLREVKGTANQIVVVDGDGTDDPTIGLHPDILDTLDEALSYEDLKDTLVAGANITLTPDDMTSTITISSSGGGGGGSPQGLWDSWQYEKIGNNNVAALPLFLGAAISSGTNNTAIPAASLLGYNDNGVFIRSSTTANGGYRYTTSSAVSMMFGTLSYKFRAQFLWRTAFTGRTVRAGYLDTTTVTDSVDGAYFEIVGNVCTAKTANNSTRTSNATTVVLDLNKAYTFDVEVDAAATAARFRVYEGQNTTPILDVTNTTNIPTAPTRTFGAGFIATESTTTAGDIGILYGLGHGTVEGFNIATAGGGGSGVASVTGTSGVSVDNTDPANPIVSASAAVLSGVASRLLVAAGTIHNNRAVAVDGGTIYHPTLATAADAGKILGLSRQSGAVTDAVLVQTDGPVTNGSWTWAPGPVFVTDEGVLSQTAPSTGWVVSIGTAVNSTTIELDVSLPILRS